MINRIEGDVRRFLTINTTHYNNDGIYAVFDSYLEELTDLGWNLESSYIVHNRNLFLTIEKMQVGDILDAEEDGAYLIRVA